MPEKTPQPVERPPIVVIMGHIDHGKSTLLDYIRKSNVVAGEAGGITQHISAYEVNRKDSRGTEKRITFLDTPGHEAFKGMRVRGSKVADIAVLVVSAEDGVKPQTIEAFKSITSSDIPLIVAINKIDKPNANIDRTKQTLAEAGIYIEGFGGDIPWVAISAKTGKGVDELLDLMLLVAEMGEFTGDPTKAAEGVVIESHMDTKRGATATVVITDGTLSKGMFVVADRALAPVRMIENFAGKTLDEASFSSPVKLIGWSEVPPVGAPVFSLENKKDAEALVEEAKKKALAEQPKDEDVPEGTVVFPVIIKSDVAGTLEAIEGELGKLAQERVRLKIIHKGVGAIGEADIKVALGATAALVLGFNTKADPLAADLALRNNISIETFDIIYKLSERVAELMKERAPRIEVMEPTGELKVLKCFSQQKDTQVIGGRVQSGHIPAGARCKIMRHGEDVGEAKITELQCQKIKTGDVSEGDECGVMVESKLTIAERDVLIPFTIVIK